MNDFVSFLSFLNGQLHTKSMTRFETMLMPANFSSMVGEFMGATIPKYCRTLVKNRYHNGHPDMLPAGRFEHDKAQHESEGIEVKGSRYLKGWQGHNAEECWLMVFAFDSNRPEDLGIDAAAPAKKQAQAIPRPFRFLLVACARLEEEDWAFAGRSATSRRTITAAVTASGYQKMMANYVYRAPSLPN